MNIERRKSPRTKTSEGREHACLIVGKREIKARILDESAGGFAVTLLENVEVQQNQVHMLKTSAGLYQTRVARIERYADGQLLGLMRIANLSEDKDETPGVSSWRDCLLSPQYANGSGGNGLAMGLGLVVVLGAVVCGLAIYGIRYFPSRRGPTTGYSARDFAEAVTGEIEKARAGAAVTERAAKEKGEKIQANLAKHTPELARQQARLSAEVLYRLQLTADQSRRVRDILNRSSGNLASAEVEIRSVLTTEQVQEWRSLAP